MKAGWCLQGCVPDAEVSAAAKEAAKAHFICHRYGEACQSYSRALQTLHESLSGSIDDKASDLYSDRALCLLRLVPPAAEAAYADCTAAIACNSANHKVCAESVGLQHGSVRFQHVIFKKGDVHKFDINLL